MKASETIDELSRILTNALKTDIHLELADRKSNELGVVVNIGSSAYRVDSKSQYVFAVIRDTGKKPYIRFSSKYAALVANAGVPFYKMKSTPDFIRIELDSFYEGLQSSAAILPVLCTIFTDLFSADVFGCCSRYNQCSDARACVHPDSIFALACQYKQNLDRGLIFYGENRNVV